MLKMNRKMNRKKSQTNTESQTSQNQDFVMYAAKATSAGSFCKYHKATFAGFGGGIFCPARCARNFFNL